MSEALVEHHPKHNETSFKPGNQVNLVHGAQVRELAKPMPGHPPPEPVQALIDWAFEVWDHLRDGDYPLARTWAYLQHRVNQMEIFYDGTTNQSILDHKGVPRKGSGTYKDLLNSKRELEKVLGIGPAPRAQMAQQIASSGKDFGLAKEAAERLRAKVKVLPPNDSPQFPPTPGDAPSEDLSNSPEPSSA